MAGNYNVNVALRHHGLREFHLNFTVTTEVLFDAVGFWHGRCHVEQHVCFFIAKFTSYD